MAHRILLGNIHLSWDVIIKRIKLGGLKKFLTFEHLPRITHFCICMDVLGCRLSVVRLYVSFFGITPLVDITIGINFAAFC